MPLADFEFRPTFVAGPLCIREFFHRNAFAIGAARTVGAVRAISARSPLRPLRPSRPCRPRRPRVPATKPFLLIPNNPFSYLSTLGLYLFGRCNDVFTSGVRSTSHSEHQRDRHRHVGIGKTSAYPREHRIPPPLE